MFLLEPIGRDAFTEVLKSKFGGGMLSIDRKVWETATCFGHEEKEVERLGTLGFEPFAVLPMVQQNKLGGVMQLERFYFKRSKIMDDKVAGERAAQLLQEIDTEKRQIELFK